MGYWVFKDSNKGLPCSNSPNDAQCIQISGARLSFNACSIEGKIPFPPGPTIEAYSQAPALKGYGSFEHRIELWPWALELTSLIASTVISMERGECDNCVDFEGKYGDFLLHVACAHLAMDGKFVLGVLDRRCEKSEIDEICAPGKRFSFEAANLRLSYILDEELQGQSRQRRYLNKTGN